MPFLTLRFMTNSTCIVKSSSYPFDEELVVNELGRLEIEVDRSLQVVKRLVEVLLLDPDLRDLEQSVARKLVLAAVFDNLLEVQHGFVLLLFVLEDFALVEMGPSVLVIGLKQLKSSSKTVYIVKVAQSLVVAFQLIVKYAPFR